MISLLIELLYSFTCKLTKYRHRKRFLLVLSAMIISNNKGMDIKILKLAFKVLLKSFQRFPHYTKTFRKRYIKAVKKTFMIMVITGWK